MGPTLFIPFQKSEDPSDLIEMAQRWIGRLSGDRRYIGDEILPSNGVFVAKPKKTLPEAFVYAPGKTPLKDRDPDQALYVLAHGGRNTDYVFNNRDQSGAFFGIGAMELAQRLAKSGARKDQKRLKLFICNVGGSMRPFAEALKGIVKPFCPDLVISYYIGSVSVPREAGAQTFHKFTTATMMPGNSGFFVLDHDSGGFSGRASEARIDI